LFLRMRTESLKRQVLCRGLARDDTEYLATEYLAN
jgi:hypothetical protein